MKVGRPEKYNIKFCFNEIKNFLSILNNDEKYLYVTWHDLVKDKPYCRQRISEWREKFKDNEEFTDTIKKIDEELENRLYKLGLKGKANATLVIFGLKNNYGWKDKSEVDQNINSNTPMFVFQDISGKVVEK
jgi:hypothetical protein